ncbi:hypothetical protein KTT_27860 [Tengunoibacter tsumagoiensis]|uniref:Uncharacterized protein n=1 Tax=Tengunoibacter tsumagoiensis TaxID=2014871 RepID=A0A402A1A4_9CHLR|nr:hypothetical protein KTT_27860 [Tengunoibacter tsumagoiensis]
MAGLELPCARIVVFGVTTRDHFNIAVIVTLPHFFASDIEYLSTMHEGSLSHTLVYRSQPGLPPHSSASPPLFYDDAKIIL